MAADTGVKAGGNPWAQVSPDRPKGQAGRTPPAGIGRTGATFGVFREKALFPGDRFLAFAA
jgi:hypothetical protein